MKRLFALLLALVMLLAMTACGKNEESTPTGENTGATTNTTESTNDTTDGDAVGATEPPTTTPPTTTPPTTTTPIPTEPTPTESPTTEPLVTEPPVTEPSEPEPIKTTSVALSVSSVKLFVGEKATVTATVNPNNATDKTIKWTSSNTAIATVANGIVTAHKVGTATITATASGGQTATCQVTVEQKEEPKPTEPPATEPPTTEPAVPTVQEKKYTGYEIVSVYSPEQALLTRFYGGANKAFNKNDSVTIQINMSNGKATEEDLSIELPYGCSYSISGNRITFVFDGSKSDGGGIIVVKNSDGTKNDIPIYFTVTKATSLSSNTAELKNQFVKYGNKRGLTFIPNGNDFVLKYNGGYTKDDKTKSITGCTIVGTDDYISMTDNPNWIYDALDLVDEYNRRGFDKWVFHINAYSFTTLAE